MNRVFFTDGACSRNGKIGAIAGAGVYAPKTIYVNKKKFTQPGIRLSERLEPFMVTINGAWSKKAAKVTNNRAELYALIMVLKIADPVGNLYVITDSEYVINWTTKLNSITETTLNRDMLLCIRNLFPIDRKLRFIHQNSHVSKTVMENATESELQLIKGNIEADKLAVSARL